MRVLILVHQNCTVDEIRDGFGRGSESGIFESCAHVRGERPPRVYDPPYLLKGQLIILHYRGHLSGCYCRGQYKKRGRRWKKRPSLMMLGMVRVRTAMREGTPDKHTWLLAKPTMAVGVQGGEAAGSGIGMGRSGSGGPAANKSSHPKKSGLLPFHTSRSLVRRGRRISRDLQRGNHPHRLGMLQHARVLQTL